MWISDFQSSSLQAVCMSAGHLNLDLTRSDVPHQGSVRGPILFLVSINDIVDLFGGDLKAKLYARMISECTRRFMILAVLLYF